MGRKRKELLSSAPWRTGDAVEDKDAARMSREGKISVTSNPGETPTMSVPRSRRPELDLTVDDLEEDEIDPELRYSFQRNSRVLDEEGIANAQKSLGLGNDDGSRRMH